MERPSQIIFEKHQSFSRRASIIAVAIGLQLGGYWLFTHGLATHVRDIVAPINFVDVHDNDKPSLPPPPEPTMKQVEVPRVPLQDFTVAPPDDNGGITVVTTQPRSTGNTGAKNAAGLDRAAVGVLSTHTVPPYPPVARRIGAEGKVTLRLTVSVEGRVTDAEIVSSSGRDELDHTAQAWIEAHWIYKPALENGVPVISHVLATVTFSLAAER